MTTIEGILSRALLARDRTVPRDIVPPTCDTTCQPQTAHPPAPTPATGLEATDAAEDLRALCETVLARTSNTDVADFVTDQLPAPRSALALACVMQLTYTDDGARFWWQYAAGAGQSAAAYCLHLHHLANGEEDLADWWHQQIRATATPAPTDDEPVQNTDPEPEWAPATHPLSTSPATMLRVLRQLARSSSRARALSRLMTYLPTAVDVGYLRHDFEIPLPGPDFAHRITALLHDAPESGRGACGRRQAGGLPRRLEAASQAGRHAPEAADH
ncbi:hypothetical protein [Streptomyces sp. enrichment culture]|uniref:hypothetical protein n=1 Tax=Streptomyces sp. enrichment culture TaxID=1795815 RepID=UPI003F566B99